MDEATDVLQQVTAALATRAILLSDGDGIIRGYMRREDFDVLAAEVRRLSGYLANVRQKGQDEGWERAEKAEAALAALRQRHAEAEAETRDQCAISCRLADERGEAILRAEKSEQRHAEAVEQAYREGKSSDLSVQDRAAWLASSAKKALNANKPQSEGGDSVDMTGKKWHPVRCECEGCGGPKGSKA